MEEKLCICCNKRPTKTPRAKYCVECSKHFNEIYRAKKKGIDISTFDFSKPKLCACCGIKPTKTPGSKYCEECSKHESSISQAKARGADISKLWFTGEKLCKWCGKRPIQKGCTKYCEVCRQHKNAVYNAKKKGLDQSSYTFTEERLCEWCGRRTIPTENTKYCEICNKYSNQICKARKKGLTVKDLDYEKVVMCECCGNRPVAKINGKYCKECSKHFSQIVKAKAKGQDISQLPFTGNRMCEICHQRPVAKGFRKYCDVCNKYMKEIIKYKAQGKDLSGIDLTQPRLCEYCGERPVGYQKQKYCDICGKYVRRIAYIQAHGITKKEDFSKPRLCKECGRPIPKYKKIYCEHCGPHSHVIYHARQRGYTGKFWFNGKICECCGKRPVAEGREKYCKQCIKRYNTHQLIFKRDLRLIEAGEKLERCPVCNRRERAPGLLYCRQCSLAIHRTQFNGTYSYRNITKPRICQNCGNRPIGEHKKKYCDICGKYSVLIQQTKKKGEDPSKLWFTGNKVCEWCGEKYISGTGSDKYCDECEKIVYNSRAERWKRALDKLEKTRPLCKVCGKELSLGGYFGRYCKKCHDKVALDYQRRKTAEARGLEDWTPVNQKQPTETLCIKCGVNERKANSKYCKKCLYEEQYILKYVDNKKQLLQPVADPEIYYTEKSVEVDCPLCEAEKCLPNLPMGSKCKDRIINHSNITSIWQKVLERRGIKAPNLEDLDPEIAKIRFNCIRCKAKPKKPGYIYCEDCMKAIQDERAHEFKQSIQKNS